MDLFSENIDLVRRIVKKFRFRGLDEEDLLQAGLMGLHAAAKNYDPKFNVKFNTYATYYILGEIRKEMRKRNPIRLSKAIYRIIRYLRDNEDKSFEDIARALSTTRETVLLAYIYKQRVLSLNREGREGGEKELLDYVPAAGRSEAFRDALASLGDGERECVEMRFFRNLSQAELAESWGMSQSKISRMEKKILKKMRKFMLGK